MKSFISHTQVPSQIILPYLFNYYNKSGQQLA